LPTDFLRAWHGHRLSKKQRLTELCCKTDARNGRGGFVTEGLVATAAEQERECQWIQLKTLRSLGRCSFLAACL
jgi:hypothetical protein